MPIEIPPIVLPAPIPGEANAYCTDEDIAIETNDFPELVPPNQIDAHGSDGSIFQADPWGLVSPSSDFVANGVRAASLIYLTAPEDVYGSEPGEVFAVAATDPLSAHTLTLRRIGRAAGQGEPPGFRDRDVTGIAFSIKTMLIQIQEATSEIDRDYGVSKFLNTTGAIIPEDWQKINRMCVYLTLAKRYLSISRNTVNPGAKDVWMDKSDRYRQMFKDEAANLTISTESGETVAPNRKTKRIFRI